MDDDFNTAAAIAKIFDMVREANLILSKSDLNESDKQNLWEIKETITEFNAFLGILYDSKSSPQVENDESYIKILLDTRNKLREQKSWDLADFIRHQLKEIGIEIEDRAEGTVWKRKILI